MVVWNIKKPCWIKCFLVCNHIFLLNLILCLSRTLWLLWVHDSFQLILPCFPFFFFLYFTFYLMDQSNHLFSYLLLCFLGGEGGRRGWWHVFVHINGTNWPNIYKWNVLSWNGNVVIWSQWASLLLSFQSIKYQYECAFTNIYILSIVMCLSVVHSFAFFFLLKQLKFLLLFSILKFCYHSNKGASKMKRGKSYFDARSSLESLIHNMT